MSQAQEQKRVHFVGIGGAGMSAIAVVAHERGWRVSGSDLKLSRYVRELEAQGVPITIGHEAQTIDREKPDVVVSSTAVPESNPEIIRARELKLEVWPRARMLAELARGSKTIAVAGTHGKTTTSSMVATMFDRMGADPAFLIGGIVEAYNTNGRDGSGDIFVAEADESDGSFLFLDPHVVIVTNIEADHLDHYGTLENIEKTFCSFMSSVDKDGCLVVCADDARALELAKSCGVKLLSYGLSEDADYKLTLLPSEGLEGRAELLCPSGEKVAIVIKQNPGVHNLLNAASALVTAEFLGYDIHKAAQSLAEFGGVRRRFTQVGKVADITIVDDYGHHPTEIVATLKAARKLGFNRLVVCFQPHRYSRTQALHDQFLDAFVDCDKLVLTDIFPAGEMPVPGVSSSVLAREIQQKHPSMDVCYLAQHRNLVDYLSEELKSGDLCITMGAGDITLLGPDVLEALNERL